MFNRLASYTVIHRACEGVEDNVPIAPELDQVVQP